MIGIPRLVGYSLAVSFFTFILVISTFAMQIQLAYAGDKSSNESGLVNVNTNYNITDSNNIQNNSLITNILAKNLGNHIQKAGAILEITSKLSQVRDVPFAHLLNQTLNTLHGIPQDADIKKRQIAKNILSINSDLRDVFFIMQNGDMYFEEPYSEQQSSSKSNFAFRDYFQGAIKTNDTYLGKVVTTTGASGARGAVIAVPVYYYSTIGWW